ncbi:MAG: GxxExxY protein [Roseiflexus sp.]|nr:GxxExxY protein [Roseiflexus sp.]MCS7290285.1 GxxExxY protein [Roseiflexus sp.]MDW8146039.1 GxxExxY protein [Roseiflexaceae bacterium]MDW8231299.1 GxxExxY protein [Roseiflexaceae bacterium]
MKHPSISEKDERIASLIVDSTFAVHKNLGPGLPESVYEVCFCHELHKREVSFRRQVVVPVFYDGIRFAEGLRLDVLVEERVACELKAVEIMHPVYTAHILTQLKLTGKRLGFLINFNAPLIKRGITRIAL